MIIYTIQIPDTNRNGPFYPQYVRPQSMDFTLSPTIRMELLFEKMGRQTWNDSIEVKNRC